MTGFFEELNIAPSVFVNRPTKHDFHSHESLPVCVFSWEQSYF